MARRQLELSNEVAAELAGAQDAILKTLEEHLSADIFLRGNVVTLDGDAEAVQLAATVVRELSELVARGHEIGPATIESVARVLDQAESPSKVLDDVVWRHRNLKVAPEVGQPEALRRRDPRARRSPSASARPAPARRSWRWRWRPPRCRAARSTASSSRRPAVEAGERLGFLPGDLMAKVDPYLRPLFDALHDMMDAERVSAHLERGVIEVAPLAFMRGRTLNDSFVILDEAQNTSPEQMKMFLTRLGFGSRMVVTGDITQIDLPREQKSGLVVVGDILDGVDGVEFVALRRRGRRAPQARAADRRRLRRARVAPGAASCARRSTAAGRREPARGGRARRRPGRRAGPPCLRARRRDRRGGGRPRGGRVRHARRDRRAQRRAPRQGGPDRRALVPRRRRRAGWRRRARARRRRDLPRAHRGPRRGGRPRRAAPRRHGPRDRRGRDARPAGGGDVVDAA